MYAMFAILLALAMSANATSTNPGGCASAFDVFFVCDNSGSIGNSQSFYGVPFMRDMIGKMSLSSAFRVSIIYFGSNSNEIHLDLSNDPVEIETTLDYLATLDSDGVSYAQDGLDNALRIISREYTSNGRTPGVIFLLFDGQNTDNLDNHVVPRSDYIKGYTLDGTVQTSDAWMTTTLPDDVELFIDANMPSPLSTIIYSIGIGGYNIDALEKLSSQPADLFTTVLSDWTGLNDITDDLSSLFCIDVTDPQPYSIAMCQTRASLSEPSVTVSIHGNGFDAAYITTPEYMCSLDGVEFPATYISDSIMDCDIALGTVIANPTSETYEFDLEISVDGGLTWTMTETLAIFVISDCDTDCFMVDYDYEGNDLREDGATSVDQIDCQIQCQQLEGCEFWTFATDGTNRCWLKDSDLGYEPQTERDSGPRLCDEPSGTPQTPTDTGGSEITAEDSSDTNGTAIIIAPGKDPLPGWVLGLILGLLFLLVLLLLWCLWPLLTGSKAEPEPLPPKEVIMPMETVATPPPAATPAQPVTKKWKTVDASSYIWASSGGGSAPLQTEWGRHGATSSAPSTNARTVEKEVTVMEEAPAPQQPTASAESTDDMGAPKKSCCESLHECCFNCYRRCAAMRPERSSASKHAPLP